MAHVGTRPGTARKAKAQLVGVDVREVSTVDRPAIGEPFVIVKSEDGMAAKNGASAVRKEEVLDAAKRPAPGGTPPAGGTSAPAGAAKDAAAGAPVLAMPAEAKGAITRMLTIARDRLSILIDEVAAAQETPDADVPAEYLVKIADVAAGLGEGVEPYAAGYGIVDDTAKATWSTAEVDKLPDSSFLYVEPGGKKDAEGKTEPRSLRHFPVKDAEGKVDLDHLRNAIAQAPKSNLSAEVVERVQSEGRKMLEQAEKAAGVTKAAGMSRCTWSQEYIDSLCDWCFLYVEPSATHDNDWRTVPLTNRHFPVRDHAGRLCLSAVLDALDVLAQPSPALAPWLTESKRIALLLRLAMDRLDEVGIAIRRDGLSPESSAELGSIAELIEMIGGTAESGEQPASPADEAGKAQGPGEQPGLPTGGTGEADQPKKAPTDGIPQLTQKMADILRKAAEGMSPEHKGLVQQCWGPMAKAVEHLGVAHKAMHALMKAVDPAFEGEMQAATGQPVFGNPPVAGAPNPAGQAAADGDVAKAVAELKKSVDTLKADNAGLTARLAKAERRVAPSNVNREEPVVKNDGARGGDPPCSMDLNAQWAREAGQQPASAQR